MNGLLIQWGNQTGERWTFPVAFSSANSYSCEYVEYRTSKTTNGWHYYKAKTATYFEPLDVGNSVTYIAIGY